MRTSLWPTLQGPKTYRIETNALLYSVGVRCWGLDPLPFDVSDDGLPFKLDVISCAAPRQPPRFQHPANGPRYRNDGDRRLMLDKITAILRAAVLKRVTTLILGAFGCGKSKNPPQEVAQITKTVLFHPPDGDNWYDCGLKTVVLAIMDDNDPEKKSAKNFAVFRDIFASEPNATIVDDFDIVKTSFSASEAYELEAEVDKKLAEESEMEIDQDDFDETTSFSASNTSSTATWIDVAQSQVSGRTQDDFNADDEILDLTVSDLEDSTDIEDKDILPFKPCEENTVEVGAHSMGDADVTNNSAH
ncbi:hypothetical protein G647_03375 [Cladophialophora carrionii CBS 160.54]|uniref:Microbial-type PARG catalytic domain-containing protein n=1 Tax=Cladophialophora carrionii CBS 160.54 TaxID=1279043 RepID=V9DKX0_9EURO|nr:uncharacterized protein G647_03375 [Cladophialophora carrionii CBS 160.54]ETI26597.1 hypothetical protein G647_03375 [Cladophialophora carrionii CBS 160.54]